MNYLGNYNYYNPYTVRINPKKNCRNKNPFSDNLNINDLMNSNTKKLSRNNNGFKKYSTLTTHTLKRCNTSTNINNINNSSLDISDCQSLNSTRSSINSTNNSPNKNSINLPYSNSTKYIFIGNNNNPLRNSINITSSNNCNKSPLKKPKKLTHSNSTISICNYNNSTPLKNTVTKPNTNSLSNPYINGNNTPKTPIRSAKNNNFQNNQPSKTISNNKNQIKPNKIKTNDFLGFFKQKFIPKINPNLEFLIKGCNIPSDQFDTEGDCEFGWRVGKFSGPPGYLKKYIPPIGCIGIGLKVKNLFDNGDNTWLGTSNSEGEWYIGYHGTGSMDSILGIINNGFRRGENQFYKSNENINPLNKKIYPKCGIGVYFTPDIEEAKTYTKIINYSGNKFRVVFMCRINPYKVRISMTSNNVEYWIVNGDDMNDLNGRKKIDEVRPYRILLFKEN